MVMNILVTESQYNRVVLNEQNKEFVLWKDAVIKITTGIDPKQGAVIPNYDLPEDDTLMILNSRVENISDKKIIFNLMKSNSPGLKRINIKEKFTEGTNLSTLNLSVILEPNESAYFSFNISRSRRGLFTQSFGVSYVVVGSKNAVYKSIIIPIYYPSDEEKIKPCKAKYNSNLLKSATDWWKSWLNNQSTKNRFAKSFKYDKSTVEKHFAEYNKILTQIPMEYVLSSKPNGGWVRTSPFSNGYDIPIVINCSVAMDYEPNESLSFMIHEVQHVLNDYHKFHPYEDMSYQDEDSSEGDISSPSKNNDKVIEKFLMTQGFNFESSVKITDRYLWMKENDMDHLKHPNEMMSSLSEVRRWLNLTPDQKITKEMIMKKLNNQKNYEDEILVFLSQWLYSKKTLEDFLNFSNSIAMRTPNAADRNLA